MCADMDKTKILLYLCFVIWLLRILLACNFIKCYNINSQLDATIIICY